MIRPKLEVFFSKADYQFLGEKPLDTINKDLINKIFSYWFKKGVNSISRLPQTTMHQVYKVKLRDNNFILKVNNYSKFFKEKNLYNDSIVMQELKQRNLAYKNVCVVDISRKLFPFDYQIMDFISDKTIFDLSKTNNFKRPIYKLGEMMAKIHSIKGKDFGPLDVSCFLRQRRLCGLYKNWEKFMSIKLDFHIKICIQRGILTNKEGFSILKIMEENFAKIGKINPVLLHGDLANHNTFTDKMEITALVDWEDSLLGDSVYDIAYYGTGTFGNSGWLKIFLSGYRSVKELPKDFELRYNLYYLRIALAKAVGRINFGKVNSKNLPSLSERIKYSLSLFNKK